MLVNSDHPCRPFLRGGWRNFACAADGGISHRSAAAGGISRSRRTAESATEPRRLAEFCVCGGRRNQPPIRGGWRKSFLRPRCPTCIDLVMLKFAFGDVCTQDLFLQSTLCGIRWVLELHLFLERGQSRGWIILMYRKLISSIAQSHIPIPSLVRAKPSTTQSQEKHYLWHQKEEVGMNSRRPIGAAMLLHLFLEDLVWMKCA